MFKKLYAILKSAITAYCDDCGGILKFDFYDAEIDRNVYVCSKCGKQWL